MTLMTRCDFLQYSQHMATHAWTCLPLNWRGGACGCFKGHYVTSKARLHKVRRFLSGLLVYLLREPRVAQGTYRSPPVLAEPRRQVILARGPDM